VDLWLELLAELPERPGRSLAPLTILRRADLRLALHTAGVARLDGFNGLSGDCLAAAAAGARGLVEFLTGWPKRGPLAAHFDTLRTLLSVHLCWDSDELEALELNTPHSSSLALDREDFLIYLERALSHLGSVPIGGAGGGVALLSGMEARSRTFDQLFIIGLNREVFPRPIAEDSLLPDALRRPLRAVLPDLPVKREGVDEDRYLFAQLLSSSHDVVLSYSASDESGRARPASPLLERLRSGSRSSVPGLLQPGGSSDASFPRPRTAHENALIAGLHGTRKQFEGALRVALDEAQRGGADLAAGSQSIASAKEPHKRARARAAIVAALDSVRFPCGELGPYLGLLGEIAAEDDPRRAPFSITRLEALAACPWQMFLHHILRIKALPDAQSSLPSVDPSLMGQLVHQTLEEISAEHLPATKDALDVVVQREPISISWPGAAKLKELVDHRAKALLLEAGIFIPGFEQFFVDSALKSLEIARCNGWPGPGSEASVLGVEVDGAAIVCDRTGSERKIRFRVDRVDATEDGLRLVDYKTGKPISELKKESSRNNAFRKEMGRGRLLQAAVYAVGAAQCTQTGAVGQYLNLAPHTADDARIAEVDSEDRDFGEVFENSVSAALDVLDCGSFVPRLVELPSGAEPRRCQFCDVKEACRRGDSGAKRALEHWANAMTTADSERQPDAERAAFRIWNLGAATT
jgi:RecB family exonuclease